ncbi:MAG: tRNA (adenosine(37)-N6)-threonylcarbamoyltransferase complex transferase subunit TsaD [Candidatus Beckwithbacteria bacterium]
MAIQNFKILAIDTSCDDTCIALLQVQKNNFKILSNIISSQVKLHQKYGGVYPSLAKREHQKNLSLVFKKAVKGQNVSKIDIIGVTAGPGLEPCLWQGINFAQELAKKLKKPVVAVNHLEAHILSNWLEHKNIRLPAVCLVVSGGHTQLILMNKIGQYRLLGETRDDAAGECFDKTARILGLGYPGGPVIAKLAAKAKKSKIVLPRPMIHQKNYDFSFSGLKTAVLYNYRSQSAKTSKSKRYIEEMCFEVQQAIIDVLIKKTIKATKDYSVKSIILGGGVAANKELRRQFEKKAKEAISGSRLYIPDFKFCTDNAAMIGVAAFFNRSKKIKEIKADANLQI